MIDTESRAVHFLKHNWIFKFGPLKNYQREKLGRIAEQLAISIQNEPRQPIPLAQKNLKVLQAKHFLKDLKVIDPRIAECRKQLLAMKLSISSEVFDRNSGFQTFAENTHLERYLMEYNHQLSVGLANELAILCNGQLTPWSEATKVVAHPVAGKKKDFSWSWLYGPKGIQNENFYNWQELTPFKQEDPAKWGRSYVFEFCSGCLASPQLNGDHSWLRLKTPTGDIYSAGFYRPDKHGNGNFSFPFRLKEADIMSPDVSEFWPYDVYSIAFNITEEQFKQMKAQIEEDKNSDNLVFHPTDRNCLKYIKKIGKIAGIKIPTKKTFARILMPKKCEPLADCATRFLPDFIIKIGSVFAAFVFNTFQLILGSSIVDSEVREKHGNKYKPHIASFWDLFRPSKASIHHPHTLGHCMQAHGYQVTVTNKK